LDVSETLCQKIHKLQKESAHGYQPGVAAVEL